MKVLTAPISVCFGITSKCNLKCRHCLASGSRARRDLSSEELSRVAQEIAGLKVFNISVFGGEPLLRKDFFGIVDRLNGSGASISLNTNGTLVTQTLAKRLAGSPIRNYTVSLDGSSSVVHDQLRGKGSFGKSIAGIHNLIRQGLPVTLSATVTRLNYLDIENMILLAKKTGVRRIRFNEVMFVGSAVCNSAHLSIPVKEKMPLLRAVQKLTKVYGGFLCGSLVQNADSVSLLQKARETARFPLRIKACGAGTVKCAIRPDGWVLPCENLWGIKAGDIRKETLYSIWHNSPVLRQFRADIVLQKEQCSGCNGCRYLRYCYQGHRCTPYYLPGKRFARKELFCIHENKTPG